MTPKGVTGAHLLENYKNERVKGRGKINTLEFFVI